jgi:hypothetical protein
MLPCVSPAITASTKPDCKSRGLEVSDRAAVRALGSASSTATACQQVLNCPLPHACVRAIPLEPSAYSRLAVVTASTHPVYGGTRAVPVKVPHLKVCKSMELAPSHRFSAQKRVDAEQEAREALLSARGSAPVPAAPLPTPAEVAAEEAARHKRETARAAVEEKRARALGLLGSTHMMAFDESSGGSDGESSEGEAPTASGGRVRDGGFRLAIGRAGMRAPMSAADSARVDALCDRASG